MLRLLTFGGLALASDDGADPPRVRPQRMALLAVLAAAGDRGVSREWMASLFWPDAGEERARHSLRQALYALKQEVGLELILPDPVMVLDRRVLSTDIGDFRAAVAAGDRVRAAHLVTGTFLEGFSLATAPEVERWVEEQRTSIAAMSTRVLQALARDAEAAADHDAAVEWWRRLTILDPLSGRFALGYLKALAAHGDRAGALAFARAHEDLVRRELEADADPGIRRLESELRALPSPPVAHSVLVDPPPRHVRPPAAPLTTDDPTPVTSALRRWMPSGRVTALALLLMAAGVAAARLWRQAQGERGPATFAVGIIREDGIPDSLRIGGVLTDMLATNLARVAGLAVLANTRLFELMLPGQDTAVAGYTEAARRAGATQIFQGRLLAGPQWGLALELQRVDLASGIVKAAYRVAASDRYALIDSMTASIARDLRVGLPAGPVIEATTDSPIAYRLYEEGLRAYFQSDHDAARRLMQSALEEDSTFAMAAYYAALLVPPRTEEISARNRALRLAVGAPERERLRITADMLALNMEPAAAPVAESLATRFPGDPRSFELLASARWFHGDWAQAATAIERAIALDSMVELEDQHQCRLCRDFERLADIYTWWDSLPAAERTATRLLRLRPQAHAPWDILARLAAARGDTTATREHFRRLYLATDGTNPGYAVRLHTLAGDYDRVERDVQPLLTSPRRDEQNDGRWVWSIALRNQGRLDEAMRVARDHAASGSDPDRLLEALVALDRGDAARLTAIFRVRSRADEGGWPPGVQARHVTWNKALYGMALAAAGDTLALRHLADTVETWGARSLYGRDRRAHHYLRGLWLVAAGRDPEAVEELRAAVHSPTHGFTRINYELGRTLLRLRRPAEAIPILRSALHGGIDGSNLYVTRTDLHELLAQAFDVTGNRDSATVHYEAVVRAWERADAGYRTRLGAARAWLASRSGRP